METRQEIDTASSITAYSVVQQRPRYYAIVRVKIRPQRMNSGWFCVLIVLEVLVAVLQSI